MRAVAALVRRGPLVLAVRRPPGGLLPSRGAWGADLMMHGSSTVSSFRDASFDPEQCMITATVHFARAPSLDAGFGLIELQGRRLPVGAHALPGEYPRRHSAVAS